MQISKVKMVLERTNPEKTTAKNAKSAKPDGISPPRRSSKEPIPKYKDK
jgi:hypothetical protein